MTYKLRLSEQSYYKTEAQQYEVLGFEFFAFSPFIYHKKAKEPDIEINTIDELKEFQQRLNKPISIFNNTLTIITQ